MTLRSHRFMTRGAVEPVHQRLLSFARAMADRASVPAGTVLFRRGDSRDFAYLLDDGEVHLVDEATEIVLERIGAGGLFGEMALFEAGTRVATAVAARDSQVFRISREMMHARMAGMDPLVSLLMDLLVDRYHGLQSQFPKFATEGGEWAAFSPPSSRVSSLRGREVETLESRQVALRELQREQDLRTAIEQAQFLPYLQPILDLRSGALAGFESLIRWNHPVRGLVSPAEFIPVAERVDVVRILDLLMLEEACQSLAALDAGGGVYVPYITVNLSGLTFETGELTEEIRRILERNGTDPARIHLEVTESAFIIDPREAREIMTSLRALGVRVALDDFGTGYSSLSYLHSFPMDTLKVDQSFVRQIHDGNQRGRDTVRAIVDLAHSFGLSVVAEGIEAAEEAAILAEIGCEYGQGYYFGRPMPLADALTYVRNHSGFPESR